MINQKRSMGNFILCFIQAQYSEYQIDKVLISKEFYRYLLEIVELIYGPRPSKLAREQEAQVKITLISDAHHKC